MLHYHYTSIMSLFFAILPPKDKIFFLMQLIFKASHSSASSLIHSLFSECQTIKVNYSSTNSLALILPASLNTGVEAFVAHL